jgi:hypothetical protein
MKHAVAVLLVLVVAAVSGCASSPPPPRPSTARPFFDDVRQLTVVVSGQSEFSVLENSAEPGRTFDQILPWTGYAGLLKPIADLVHQVINWFVESDRKADASADVRDLSPARVVARAFEARLRASGRFDDIRTLEGEPVGDEPRPDVVLRLTVPTWGLVRVREGEPDLVSAFADVRAEMVARQTGVALWKDNQDVTGAERLPLKAFTGNRQFARRQLLDVLDRAGQRLASELLYAQGVDR